MKRIIFILHFCLFIFILNCASYNIETIRNDSEKSTIYRMKDNHLSPYGSLISIKVPKVSLILQKLEYDNLISFYSLILTYISKDWISIEKGQSLKLIVDGKSFVFTGNGSLNHKTLTFGTDIKEMAWYAITPEQIKTIINAGEVEVIITGSQDDVQRKFNKTNFLNFRKFYNQFCI